MDSGFRTNLHIPTNTGIDVRVSMFRVCIYACVYIVCAYMHNMYTEQVHIHRFQYVCMLAIVREYMLIRVYVKAYEELRALGSEVA